MTVPPGPGRKGEHQDKAMSSGDHTPTEIRSAAELEHELCFTEHWNNEEAEGEPNFHTG